MSFALRYTPPDGPVALPTDPSSADVEDVVDALGLAGAYATVEIDDYVLGLGGQGPRELLRGCAALVDTLRAGAPDEVAWVFGSFMTWLPVVTFTLAGPEVSILTRTHDEAPGGGLIVLEGRDLPEPVRVPAQAVLDEARAFIARCLADADRVLPAPGDARGYRERAWT